jgi:type I restriction enzyme S subunit
MVSRPPLPEQTQIAVFLDRETAKIDELVAEQRRLMALLKEKRQAVISHAVTRGLNPDAPLKPSGIEWLGDVPAHWVVVPLRWAAKCCSGDGLSSLEVESVDDEEHQVRVIGGNGVMGYTDQKNVEHSVLAVGRVGALCGNVHIVNPPAWITDNALVLDPDHAVFDLQFLSLVLRSRNLNDIASKTAQPLITGTQVSDQRIPAPPLKEQQDIAAFLTLETSRFDTLTTEAQRAIDLLQERRTALISAAVTGQIDVRGAVAA